MVFCHTPPGMAKDHTCPPFFGPLPELSTFRLMVIIIECWESNVYFEALSNRTLKSYSYMYNGCSIWYTLIRFFMIVCSLILITRTISGHMYELSLQWMAGTNEQSGRSIHTQIHSWENITGVIYKTLVWENETTFGVSGSTESYKKVSKQYSPLWHCMVL